MALDDLYKTLYDKYVHDPISPQMGGDSVGSHSHSALMNTASYKMRFGDIMEMVPDELIVGFDTNFCPRIFKNRMAPIRKTEELDVLISVFSRALVKKFLEEKMALFEDTLTNEMIHVIKQTLFKEGESQ